MSRSSSPVAHRGENPSRVSPVRSIDSSGGAITLPGRQARAPHAGSAVEQPSETEATPLPPSAPSLFRGRTTPWASAHQALANRAAAHRATAHRVSAGGGLEEIDVPAGVVKSATAHRVARTVTTAGAASWESGLRRKLRISDWACIVAAVFLAHTFRWGFDAWELGDTYFWVSLGIIVLWCLDLEFGHSRDARVLGLGASEYKALAHSATRVFVLAAAVLIVVQGGVLRGFFLTAFPCGLLLLLLSRWLWRRDLNGRRRRGEYLQDVVVIGRTKDVESVILQLQDNPAVGYRVAGVALNSLPRKASYGKPWYRIPVMSTLDDIEELVRRAGASIVIVAGTLPGGSHRLRELGWRLEDLSTELVLASRLTDIAGPRVHYRPVEGMPLMHVELPQFTGTRHLLKRLVDLTVGILALVILAPVLLLLAVVVKADSSGPVFYSQERIGRNGTTFRMHKFRSMTTDADLRLAELSGGNQGSGPLFKLHDDPRVTRCGKWMRRYSLDELPQLFNVLTGEMSLVGPRPPLRREVEAYEQPAHRRLLIKPGITGLWQISGRSNLSWQESVRLDLYYVENWSLMGDLMIMWRTAKAMVSAEGAY